MGKRGNIPSEIEKRLFQVASERAREFLVRLNDEAARFLSALSTDRKRDFEKALTGQSLSVLGMIAASRDLISNCFDYSITFHYPPRRTPLVAHWFEDTSHSTWYCFFFTHNDIAGNHV
jgi:hypothetical protein